MNNNIQIILASTSPIRRLMMEESNLIFEARKPECDEEELKKSLSDLKLSKLALELAKAKAKTISELFPNAYVIGSDQICEIEGEIISKSKNYEEAFDTLQKLSGKTHIQNNGTCIYHNSLPFFNHVEQARLTMKKLNEKEIKDYISKDDPIGCAGSYKYELNGKNLFEKVEGSEECIKGFAISKVKKFLENT